MLNTKLQNNRLISKITANGAGDIECHMFALAKAEV